MPTEIEMRMSPKKVEFTEEEREFLISTTELIFPEARMPIENVFLFKLKNGKKSINLTGWERHFIRHRIYKIPKSERTDAHLQLLEKVLKD